VHHDHGVFAEGLALKKKLKLTFFSEKLGRNMLLLCAPLHYSEGKIPGDGMDSYYFWNYRTRLVGNNVVSLSPAEILHMELTGEPYDIEEFTISSQTQTRPDSVKSPSVGPEGS